MGKQPKKYQTDVENEVPGLDGTDNNDSSCLRTAGQLMEYIDEIGFLPLFKNDVTGFSVEEHTVAEDWWSGDAGTDPWEWRIVAARSRKVAYGKFFNKKAGFISKKWFPYFANYRRDGYDFDALWDDGKANINAKKIMDLFYSDDEILEEMLYSYDIKKRAGFGGTGEKNFEGIITGLQMQAYLCVGDFCRKRNRFGKEYGWPVAVYAQPELLWGYEYVSSAYTEEPEESFRRMEEHVAGLFPDASKKQISRILRIGCAAEPERKKVICDYPQNLLEKIDIRTDKEINRSGFTQDQLDGLAYAISQLQEKEREVIRLRYQEGMTFRAIGEKTGGSGGYMGMLHKKALRKLGSPSFNAWYVEGLEVHKARLKVEAERAKKAVRERWADKEGMMGESILELHADICLLCRLLSNGINKIEKLRDAMQKSGWQDSIRGIGDKSADELVCSMLRDGFVDEGCPAVREYEKRKERVAKRSMKKRDSVQKPKIFKRREVDYPANIIAQTHLYDRNGFVIDCHRLTEDQKQGVEALITATSVIACWQNGGGYQPVTSEVLHYYYRDGMPYNEIAQIVGRKTGKSCVERWTGRVFWAAEKKLFYLWAVYGASYTITADDVMKHQAALARREENGYWNTGKDNPKIWDYYILYCRRELQTGWNNPKPVLQEDWNVYAQECYGKLCEKMSAMADIMKGMNWLKAGGLPKGYRLEETGRVEGICKIWKKGNPDEYWW